MPLARESARQQFVDDELLRLPMVADQVLTAVWPALQHALPTMSPHERVMAGELMQVGMTQRARMVERFAESLRRRLREQAPAPVEPAIRQATPPGLALLDEAEVAADVEILRAVEAIKVDAEHELRELATYTSALAGDMDVSRDHNPFRPEAYAQAMWDAAQALPMARGYQVQLMRIAAQPLAQVLRRAYAGACSRLEEAGVEPAAYRTLILPSGSRRARATESWQGEQPDLNRIRDAMPATLSAGAAPGAAVSREVPLDHALSDADAALRALPADAPPSVRAQLLESQRARLVRHARSAVDQQCIELLSRLFEAMMADARVPADVRAVLARMQPSTLRLVLRDASALDDYAHPVWHFMDMAAHGAALQPEGTPERDQALRLTETLIDELAGQSVPDAAHYRTAVDRLQAHEQARFAERRLRCAADFAALQALEDRLPEHDDPGVTGAGPLDFGQLDTVPADLIDKVRAAPDDAADTVAWLAERRPGNRVRLFNGGRWNQAQLLWLGSARQVWLFGLDDGSRTLAFRRRALERLHAQGLLTSLRMRSLLRSAAFQVVRATGAPQGSPDAG